MAKTANKRAEEYEGTRPRGFYSPESTEKLKQARALVAERYPAMSTGKLTDIPPDDVTRYLMEVGAGRLLALANFEKANGKETRQSAKGAKAPKPKKGAKK